jgi:hypothetical protein
MVSPFLAWHEEQEHGQQGWQDFTSVARTDLQVKLTTSPLLRHQDSNVSEVTGQLRVCKLTLRAWDYCLDNTGSRPHN